MKKFWVTRLTNSNFIVALLGFIYLVLTDVFHVKIVQSDYATIVNSLVSLLVLGGIINNPCTDKLFGDDKEEGDKK